MKSADEHHLHVSSFPFILHSKHDSNSVVIVTTGLWIGLDNKPCIKIKKI